MRFYRFQAVLGFILVIVQFLGIPGTIKSYIAMIVGAIILGIAVYFLHREYRRRHRRHGHHSDTFVESHPVRHAPPARTDYEVENTTDETTQG